MAISTSRLSPPSPGRRLLSYMWTIRALPAPGCSSCAIIASIWRERHVVRRFRARSLPCCANAMDRARPAQSRSSALSPTRQARGKIACPRFFAAIRSVRAERQYYRLRLRDRIPPPAIPQGFRLRPIDETLLSETALANLQVLVAEIHSEAPSVADFLAHKFGYCLQHGQELAGWCLSEYNHGERCELGIETLPAFQRRGLATVTALATIAHAQSAGIAEIGWHCWKRNMPSIGLARKLGFEHVADYPVWHCRFEPPTTEELRH